MVESVQPKADQEKQPGDDLTVKGRFARYNSPFLQLLIPLLTTRYVWLTVEDLNPLNFLKKPDPAHLPDFKPWVKPTALRSLSRNFASIGMGATTLGVIAYYSKRTYDDIKTLYAESIGYELNKKPEDVNWQDIFLKSKNEALVITRDAFIKRSFIRTATGAAFLLPWHKLRDFKHATPKYDTNLNAGVGAVGTYLSLDGFLRKQSFFEAEQSMVDTTINHMDTNTSEIMHPKHIHTLLYLQRKHVDKHYKWPVLNSPEGRNEEILANRITDLLNETYDNTTKTEHADFTIGKFNYLVGFGLLDKFAASLGFVELANKSKDMQDVNKAAASLKSGKDAQAVFMEYGINLNDVVKKYALPEQFVEPVVEQAGTKFTDLVSSTKDKVPQAIRTHQDFAAQGAGPLQVN